MNYKHLTKREVIKSWINNTGTNVEIFDTIKSLISLPAQQH